MAEICFCQDGLNQIKQRFKPLLAETCKLHFVLMLGLRIIGLYQIHEMQTIVTDDRGVCPSAVCPSHG